VLVSAAMASPSVSVLVFSVLRAVITLALVCCPGFIAGYLGFINRDFLQRLSRFQVTFLMPSLAFSTFGARFTAERFQQIWPLAVWSAVQLVVGTCLSKLILRTRTAERWARQGSEAFATLLQMAVTFQNIGIFNFPLIQALCNTPGLFPGHDENCYNDGILMIFGYHIPWDLSLWTQGYAAMMALGRGDVERGEKKDALSPPPSGKMTVQPVARSDGLAELPVTVGKQFGSQLRATLSHAAGHFMNPMVAAMMTGIACGLTPPIRESLFGQRAAFGPLGDALKQLGGPAPTIGLQILSGTLGLAVRQFKDAGDTNFVRRPGQQSWMAAVLAGKLLLMPLIGFTIFTALSALQRFEYVPPIEAEFLQQPDATSMPGLGDLGYALWPNDKLLRAVVVMQWTAPSCLNIAVLCHRVGLDDSIVQALSALYLAMYGITILTTTFWVASGLALF